MHGPRALSPTRNLAECQIGFQAHLTYTGWGKVYPSPPQSVNDRNGLTLTGMRARQQAVVHEISHVAAREANEYYMMFDLYHSIEVDVWTANGERSFLGTCEAGRDRHRMQKRPPLTPSSSCPSPPLCYMAGEMLSATTVVR